MAQNVQALFKTLQQQRKKNGVQASSLASFVQYAWMVTHFLDQTINFLEILRRSEPLAAASRTMSISTFLRKSRFESSLFDCPLAKQW
jgi:hypothetical protein